MMEITFLETNLERTAEWRRSKAEEYPDDADRNLAAAKLCDDLAGQVAAGQCGAELMAEYVGYHDDIDMLTDICLAEGDVFGRIGFDYWPTTVDELIEAVLTESGVRENKTAEGEAPASKTPTAV